MKAYCEQQGFSIRQINSWFGGQPINKTDTPAEQELATEDAIGVFQQPTGVSSKQRKNLLLFPKPCSHVRQGILNYKNMIWFQHILTAVVGFL